MSPKIKIAAAFFTAFLMAGSSLAQHTGPEDEPEGVPEGGRSSRLTGNIIMPAKISSRPNFRMDLSLTRPQ